MRPIFAPTLGLLCLLALSAPACSESDEDHGSTGGGGAGGTGGSMAGAGGVSGAGAGGAGGTGGQDDAGQCPTALPAGWAPLPRMPSKFQLGACTPAMISAYAQSCLAFNGPPCPAFAADGDPDKAKCEACLWSGATDSSYGAFIALDTGFAVMNQGGCLTELGVAGGVECADTAWANVQCAAEVCQACADQNGNITDECRKAASAGPCASLAKAAQGCTSFLSTPCYAGDLPTKAAYVMNMFCGTGVAADGGTDAGIDASTD